MTAARQTIEIPKLAEGEIYIGMLGNSRGELYHVVLLPGDNDDAPWQAQMDWAKSIGGDLPNRIEQAMLWAEHRDQLQEDLYWSNTVDGDVDAYAWFQDFLIGGQLYLDRSLSLRARAVRRLPIQSFGNSDSSDAPNDGVTA